MPAADQIGIQILVFILLCGIAVMLWSLFCLIRESRGPRTRTAQPGEDKPQPHHW